MSHATNLGEAGKALFRAYVGIWESGRVGELTTVLHDDYVGHASSGDRRLVALRERVAAFREFYPDVRFKMEDQIAEGDKVASRLTATARRSSDGQLVRLHGLNICRIKQGRIVEEWMTWEVQPVADSLSP